MKRPEIRRNLVEEESVIVQRTGTKREREENGTQLCEVNGQTLYGKKTGEQTHSKSLSAPVSSLKETMRPEAVGRVRQQVSHRSAPNKVQTTQRASNRPVGETIAENEALKRVRVTKY